MASPVKKQPNQTDIRLTFQDSITTHDLFWVYSAQHNKFPETAVHPEMRSSRLWCFILQSQNYVINITLINHSRSALCSPLFHLLPAEALEKGGSVRSDVLWYRLYVFC